MSRLGPFLWWLAISSAACGTRRDGNEEADANSDSDANVAADGDADVDGDSDADGDSDVDADSDCTGGGEGEGEGKGEGEGSCRSGDPLANGGCDWSCNSEAYFAFRFAAVILTNPVTLLDTLAEEALDGMVEHASPGVVLEITNPMPKAWYADYRMGLASCHGPGLSTCSFDGEPAAGRARLEEDTTALFVPGLMDQPGTNREGFSLDLALADSCGRPFTLPLRELRLDTSFPKGYGCIGHVEEGPDGPRWNTARSALVGLIPTDEAKRVWIQEVGKTLCDVIAAGDCDVEPEAVWPFPPEDTTLDGTPAWGFALRLAAIGVSVEE